MDEDRDQIIARCREKNMILNLVGTQKDTSARALELAMQHDNMYASLGTHPNHLYPTYITEEESAFMSREEDFDESFYEELYNKAPEKIIGIGETGLDLFHIPDPKEKPTEEILEKQKKVFTDHAKFAEKYNLPLVIHVREAHEHMIPLLRSFSRSIRATIHCFSGNWDHAQEYLAMGCYLGFTGVITFPAKKTNPKPQEELLEVVAKTPIDRIIVETDAPYLAPQKYRGERAEPWMCEEQIRKIAEVRGLAYGEVEKQVFENSLRLFDKVKIPSSPIHKFSQKIN